MSNDDICGNRLLVIEMKLVIIFFVFSGFERSFSNVVVVVVVVVVTAAVKKIFQREKQYSSVF